MGEHSVTLLAAEEGGTQNFLIPNGTFFFVLAIFLIVLGVIGKFVVPPVQKVLGEREAMVAKTTEDNRRANEQQAAADSDYQKEMAAARTEASGIRDEARAYSFVVRDEQIGALAALALPPQTRVICIYRDGRMILPDADTELKSDDEVVLLTHRDSLAELDRQLGVPA